MTSSALARALVGVLILAGVLTASLLVSPTATAAFAESVADDPAVFGLLVAGLYLVRPLFAWPTTPLAVVVGYGFGVGVGIPVALVGVLCSVTPVFFVARWVAADDGDDSVTASWVPFSGVLEWASDAACRYYETAGPIRGVTVSRLAPVPSDVSTCAAAVSGVRYRHLLVGTALGELPWTIAAVIVGASAATISSEGIGDVGVSVVLACVLAAALLLAGPAHRVARGRFPELG